jgi:DNA-binding NarL/FixJ family response regulator
VKWKTKLTPRESMLWAMAASGSRDKQIASELGLSRQRVSDILVSLRRKLGIEPQGARMLVAAWYQRQEETNRARNSLTALLKHSRAIGRDSASGG